MCAMSQWQPLDFGPTASETLLNLREAAAAPEVCARTLGPGPMGHASRAPYSPGMMRPAIIRRTQSGRIDFAFGVYGGNRMTYKLAVAMPIPGKLLWSVTLCDAALAAERLGDAESAAGASFELKEEPGTSLEPALGPFVPNSVRRRGIKTMSGRGWYEVR
jgi:hypothetical protein